MQPTRPLTPDTVRAALVRAGRQLPASVAESVLALGLDAVPPLLDVLEDPLLDGVGPPGAWAPLHAAELLGRLQALEALPVLLDAACFSAPDDELAPVAIRAVHAFGAQAMDEALSLWDDLEPDQHQARDRLAMLMAGLGVRDDAIFSALVAFLDVNPAAAAMALGEYGDPEAVPHLRQALDLAMARDRSRMQDVTRLALHSALVALGAEGNAELAAQWAAAEVPSVNPPTTKPGRNDPCWCGSGQKYKKCHLRADDAG